MSAAVQIAFLLVGLVHTTSHAAVNDSGNSSSLLTTASPEQHRLLFRLLMETERQPSTTTKSSPTTSRSKRLVSTAAPIPDKAPVNDNKRRQGICPCPDLMMATASNLSAECSNWDSIEEAFSLAENSTDSTQVSEWQEILCKTKLVCRNSAQLLVKWHDSSMCDVQPLVPDVFQFECNGTLWKLHGFPVQSATCATFKR